MSPKDPSEDKEIQAAIERFEKAREEGNIPYFDAEQYEDIIEHYICNKNYPKAIEAIEMALQIHPDNIRLIATRVALYIDEEKIKEARKAIDKVLDDNSFPIQLIHTELLVAEGKEEEARKILDALDEDSTDEVSCLEVGILCCDLGFYDKALEWLKKCLSFNPENEDAISAICECYQYMGQYSKTINLYNELIDKDPYSADYWSGLGKSYFYMGQFDKAVEACDFALVSNEETGEAYTIKGHAYYQLENYQESVKAYKEAYRLGSLEVEFAPMFIAFSYIGAEEWDNAYEYIKEAITQTNENSPVFPDLLVNSARCLYKMNRSKEAHSTLELVQERFPENMLACIYNGSYYLKEGDRDKAIFHFNKALEISPTADTWSQISTWAINCEDYELAKYALDHVRDIDPDFENLVQDMHFVTGKLTNKERIMLNRKIFKEYLRNAVSLGMERPEAFNIDNLVQQARKEGKSEDEIDEIAMTLEQLNDLLENYDIDQEEDEIDDNEVE